jgi:ribonuclease P protein component
LTVKLTVLRRRAEFLAVAQTNKKWVATGLILQLGPKKTETADTKPSLRYGLTATTKIGNAVVRNRARRRLRALAFEILPPHASNQHDYVLIARATTAIRDHSDLKKDLITGLKKLGVWTDSHV